MKYFIIIILCLLFSSCIDISGNSARYEIAYKCIDSIATINDKIDNILSAEEPNQNMNEYVDLLVYRYTFAKLYQMELNELPEGDKKKKLTDTYHDKVKTEPWWYFPYAARDSVGTHLVNLKEGEKLPR